MEAIPSTNTFTPRYNYITTNRFYVEMESTISASFSECSGWGVTLQKEAYLEGGVNDQQRVFIGHAEFDDITLKRGMTNSTIFWNWMITTMSNPIYNRRNINILMFNQAGEIMQAWTLIGAIPISWKAPGFQAEGSSVAIEELTLAYEGLQVTTQTQGAGGVAINRRRDRFGYF
ncbi:phage tail protein [Arthrospira platensis]|jgi:phage tail-like protein|uniref:Phage tail protein n=1 Tax=Limnospira platensis NIES-46 TaxID=1236695 RepID=A0A5M3T261_LIMPL|nr:phage tail protein [Arthrospira platensis]AMW31390.1 phage tail protein [Arthrospira platensis YZ]KDR56124.1 phage tail protein [Arthrospira platensis str. Paraca]MBD2668992.1 phage tail protein [Arthrospira platensis FACHB-439]MBD2709429.1 phage tail protein [Arthrospira platensis FACHB-835]MDF2208882.1 phage tail protein [Arthrospira platensis NCB002]MDT9182080.1 phage tail protein [Limnospira sp. PMC 289.06]MDT9294224.1 phage tail protein [Arthrospira platensis PCC 7345]MDT9312590.1 p